MSDTDLKTIKNWIDKKVLTYYQSI